MINRVLFYNSGGGIGDAIQILPLIITLKKEFKNADFFYLCAHDNHFNSSLKNLNCSIQTLSINIKYFGFRWWHIMSVKEKIKMYGIKKFDLIIDLQSKLRNTLILKRIPHEYFISPCVNFKLSKPSLNIKKSQNINKDILFALNATLKTNFKMIGYDTKNIENKFVDEAIKLLPNNNYVGLSITQGNVYRKKEWPTYNIVELCNKLKLKKKIPVFFIKKKKKMLKDKIINLVQN